METHYEAIGKAHTALARERVMTDLKTLARDAEGLLKATAGDMTARAKEARARLGSALEKARAGGLEARQRTVASVKAAARRTDAAVREHPVRAVGIAFGVGLLAGLWLARR